MGARIFATKPSPSPRTPAIATQTFFCFFFYPLLSSFFFLFSLLGSGRLLFHKLGTVGHKQIDTYFWSRGDVCGAPTAQITHLRYLLRQHGDEHTDPGRARGASRGTPGCHRRARLQRRWGVGGSGGESDNSMFWFFIVLICLIPSISAKCISTKENKNLKCSTRCHLKLSSRIF